MALSGLFVDMEDLLYVRAEVAGERDGERQRGRVALLIDRVRATWAAGDWDRFARVVAPVGARVLERAELEPGLDLLDVGTGSGGNIALPAALGGAKVVGLDVTPELFEHARRPAAGAG